MENHSRPRATLAWWALFAALLLVALLLLVERGAPATVEVSARGQVLAQPDALQVRATLEHSALEVSEAKQVVDARVEKLLQAAQSLGIEEGAIEAGQLEVQPKFRWDGKRQQFEGYQARRHLLVRFEDLARYPAWLEQLARGNVRSFHTSAPYFSQALPLKEQAMEQAFAEARRKAQVLASQSQRRLGAVLAVEEVSEVAIPLKGARMMAESDSGSYHSGEQAVTVQLRVRFQLD